MRKHNRFLHKKYSIHRKRVLSLRHHPFVVPVVTFMALFFVSMLAFIVFGGGSTVGPADSHVVNVYADDIKRTLPTRASTVEELLNKLSITINDGDVVEPSLDSRIIDDNFNINIYRAREVLIIDNGKKTVIKTPDQSARIVARKAGIVVYPEDEITPQAPDDILDEGVVGERYVIKRATPVTLILYGAVSASRTQAKTVGDFLAEKNIQVSDKDTVSPARDAKLSADTQIVITRPGQQIATTEEAIPAPTEFVDDPNLTQGETAVREPGAPGKKIVTYDIKTENGVEVSRTVLQEVVALQPQRILVARGTKVIISNPSENVKIGESMAAARGWTGQQWYCLYQLWQKESKWSTVAGNPSGAYGIPQALPGSKMASSGADWRTNPRTQIAWGFGYISGRYGTPCSAWQSSQTKGWY